MTNKRALIVDDSKSARFALKRMLNQFNLEVDTVESAADALDYLQHHHPDVIFMDHMMPGMDGFEAVKRIKENPLTVVIPIMMYTSKGGDLYLSQARALGAVGIIPKTIAHVELRESLLVLGLIDEEPIKSTLKIEKPEITETSEKVTEKKPVKKKNVLDIYVADLRKLMDDQTIELHRSMWLGIESVSNEIFIRLNNELDEKISKLKPSSTELSHRETLQNRIASWPIYMVSAMFILSTLINIALFLNLDQAGTETRPVSNKEIVLPVKDEPKIINQNTVNNSKAIWEFTKWALNKTIEYPYNELALNDSRLPRVKELVSRALDAGFTGHIILQTHVGEFCLSSDQLGGYVLADNSSPITACEYIGNYIQPGDEPASHQSLGFVNHFSDSSLLYEKGIVLEVVNVSRKVELVKYPRQIPQTTVEKWNMVAQRNNRITVKLEPKSIDELMAVF